MRKIKTITEVEKQEIMAYATTTSPYEAQQKYHVWAETIKYWIDPSLRKKVKQTGKQRWHEKMKDPEFRKKWNEGSKQYARTEEGKKYNLAYRLNPARLEHRNRTIKQHRLDNLEHYKQRSKARYFRDKISGRLAQLRKQFPNKLKANIREAVRRALKQGQIDKNAPSIQYLGCTIDEFKQYITAKFLPGMNWDNHGRGEQCWHLDHIVPLASLELGNLDQLKQLCHYTNYQPLWEKDNLSKQDKMLPVEILLPTM